MPNPVRYGTGSTPALLLDLKIVLSAQGGSFQLRSRRILCIHELLKKQARFNPNKQYPNSNQFNPLKSCRELGFPQLSGGKPLTSLLLGANCSQGPYLHPGDGLGHAVMMGEWQPHCGLGGLLLPFSMSGGKSRQSLLGVLPHCAALSQPRGKK